MEKPKATPLPTLGLLSLPPNDESQSDPQELVEMAEVIESFLADHKVRAQVCGFSQGPIFTLFELYLAPGVTVSRVTNLQHDLARRLSAESLRVLQTIPGKPYVGIELQNKYRQAIYLREVLDSPAFIETPALLSVALGKDSIGKPVIADLTAMPHLLIGGMTGSGKSVLLDNLIMSMLYKEMPENLRFIMIDPKMLDLSFYEGIPHLLTSVISDMSDATNAVRWCVGEMERRYKLMYALGVRSFTDYNHRINYSKTIGRPIPDPFWKPGFNGETQPSLDKEPYIVVIIDNFSELKAVYGEPVKELLDSLVRKSHVAGIHLILVNTLPSADRMASSIKENIPARVALTVRSKGDSNSILDQGGAELLLGAGDMLYLPFGSSVPIRVHGAYVHEQDIRSVVQDWKARGRPLYLNSIIDRSSEFTFNEENYDDELDALFDQAVAFVVDKRRASIAGIQRQFRIGYNRAARIVEQMEAQGIVSSLDDNGNREILAPSADS